MQRSPVKFDEQLHLNPFNEVSGVQVALFAHGVESHFDCFFLFEKEEREKQNRSVLIQSYETNMNWYKKKYHQRCPTHKCICLNAQKRKRQNFHFR